MNKGLHKMRHSFSSKTREEIKKKLIELYSSPLISSWKVLDFDRGYDFFSDNEASMIRYSSKWFTPDKYDQQIIQERIRQNQEFAEQNQMHRVNFDEAGYRNIPKNDSAWKLERLGCPTNQLTRDLEKLGRTPYHIGMEGEKFRVVAATLQKCNSPFVRRTFQFTSNGIIETPETRNDGDQMKIIPIINQAKKGVTQKLVTIRRFRVIKKDGFTGEKALSQKVNVSNGEKPRFLAVRIRSKERHNNEVHSKKDTTPEVVRLTSSTEEEDCDSNERATSPPAQAEETDDGEEPITRPTTEESVPEGKNDPEEKKTEEIHSNDTEDVFHYENFQKSFPTYPNQSQQQQACNFCTKKFISVKQLREHVRVHHPQHRYTRSSGTVEDRIKTATSKFGRTRRVLNIAGLRSKYKML